MYINKVKVRLHDDFGTGAGAGAGADASVDIGISPKFFRGQVSKSLVTVYYSLVKSSK